MSRDSRGADLAGEVVIVGVGEMGSVFARACLRADRVVVPVNRSTSMAKVAERFPAPELCLVAVGENDLDGVLENLPDGWRTRIGLLQNELRPVNWKKHALGDPTLIVVWFEKKRERPLEVILPTVIGGPSAHWLAEALSDIGVAAQATDDPRQLAHALAAKNLYILTANVAGLVVGGTVGELLTTHQPLALEIAQEILDIEERLSETELHRDALLEMLLGAFASDPYHLCLGRTANERLTRTIAHADALSLRTPRIRAIARSLSAPQK